MRDLDGIAPGYQVLAASISPSHAYVHIVDFGKTVKVLGMTVKPGDFIHADRHGALIIPPKCLPLLAKSIDILIQGEQKVIKAAKKKNFSYAKLEEAWKAFEKIRNKKQV